MWMADVGAPAGVRLLPAAGVQPRRDALRRMPAADFPLDTAAIRATVFADRLSIRFPLGRSEQLYGLGLNFKAVQQRGTVRHLHVDHYGGVDNGRTHAPVPFYVSSGGYGVLIDAARYATVYAGTAVRVDSRDPPPVKDRNTDRTWTPAPRSDAVEVVLPARGVTLYVFAGPTPLNAIQRYNLYSGGGVLPPKWGLGFHHRLPTRATAEDVIREVDAFAARGFPLDVVGLEPGWQSAAYPGSFVWDPTRYPDVAGFMREMQRRSVRVNLWINPYVAPSAPFYDAIKPLSGSHTVWTGLVPDFNFAQTQKIVLDHFRRAHLDVGVSGYKIDEVDGYDRWLWPDHAVFPSLTSGEEMRQIYGVVLQRVTAGMFRERDQRTWGLVRASNAGAASFPYVLYNDYYSHPDFITALVNSGFIGVLWTPEVRSSKTAEDWLRRMQSVCFSPMALLNAWSDGTEPWTFLEVEDAVREVMRLRIRLLPYLYTTFAQYNFQGTPPLRALALVDSSPSMSDVKDEFVLGDDLLVAPMFAGDTSRRVVLPGGKWYDFYTGAFAGENAAITVRPGMRIPLFVRDGGVIPLLADGLRQIPRATERVDLEVRHYGEAPGGFELYDDDGVTFAYERGEYSWTTLRVRRGASGKLRGEVIGRSPGRPFTYGTIRWRLMTPP